MQSPSVGRLEEGSHQVAFPPIRHGAGFNARPVGSPSVFAKVSVLVHLLPVGSLGQNPTGFRSLFDRPETLFQPVGGTLRIRGIGPVVIFPPRLDPARSYLKDALSRSPLQQIEGPTIPTRDSPRFTIILRSKFG